MFKLGLVEWSNAHARCFHHFSSCRQLKILVIASLWARRASNNKFWPTIIWLLLLFGLFWTFLMAPLKFSLSLVGSIRYPDILEVLNNLSLSDNLDKNVSRLPSPLKITHLAVLGPFGSSWWLLGNARIPEHCKSLQITFFLSASRLLSKFFTHFPL